MARLRKNKDHKIELFPFLSVLICTIGVLTLILISSVLGQVDAVVDTADKYRGIVRQLDKINSQISQWQSAVDSKKAQLAKLEAALNEIEQLLGELGLIESPEEYQGIYHALKETRKNIEIANDDNDNVRIEIETADPDGVYSGNATPEAIKELDGLKKKLNALLRIIDAAVAQIGKLNQDQKGLQQDLEIAQKSLDKEDPTGTLRKTPVATREMLKRIGEDLKRTNAEVDRLKLIIPDLDKKLGTAKVKLAKLPSEFNFFDGGSGVGFKARYVECTKNGVKLDPNLKKGGKVLKLSDKRFEEDNLDFRTYVRKINALNGVRLVLLIRPSGVKNYHRARDIAAAVNSELKPGYLPLPREDMKIPIQDEKD